MLEQARAIAASFVQIARAPGWTETERQAIAACAGAFVRACDVLINDLDHPDIRRRRAGLLDEVHDATGPAVGTRQAAAVTGLSRSRVIDKAKALGLGHKVGGGRTSELRLLPTDVMKIAASSRGRLP